MIQRTIQVSYQATSSYTCYSVLCCPLFLIETLTLKMSRLFRRAADTLRLPLISRWHQYREYKWMLWANYPMTQCDIFAYSHHNHLFLKQVKSLHFQQQEFRVNGTFGCRCRWCFADSQVEFRFKLFSNWSRFAKFMTNISSSKRTQDQMLILFI